MVNKQHLIFIFLVMLIVTIPFSYALPLLDLDGGQTSDFLYTGKEKDKETGLYYYGARYYDTDLMTFITPEKDIPNLYNPQDLNHYTYVRNNPYKYVDPTGEVPVETIVDVVFIAYGSYQFARDPSLQTFSDLGIDVGFALLPYVPNVKRVAEGAKAINKAIDVVRGGENLRGLNRNEVNAFRKIENIKGQQLTDKTLEGARTELGGGITKLKESGQPFDHITKVQNAQQGLIKQVNRLIESLKDNRLTPEARKSIEKKLGEASRLLDKSERYVPRNRQNRNRGQ